MKDYKKLYEDTFEQLKEYTVKINILDEKIETQKKEIVGLYKIIKSKDMGIANHKREIQSYKDAQTPNEKELRDTRKKNKAIKNKLHKAEYVLSSIYDKTEMYRDDNG